MAKKKVSITQKGNKAKRSLLVFSLAPDVGTGFLKINGGAVVADALDFLKVRNGQARLEDIESFIELKHVVPKSDAREITQWMVNKGHVVIGGERIPKGMLSMDDVTRAYKKIYSEPSPKITSKSPRITPKRPRLKR